MALNQCNTFLALVKTKSALKNQLLCTGNADLVRCQQFLYCSLHFKSELEHKASSRSYCGLEHLRLLQFHFVQTHGKLNLYYGPPLCSIRLLLLMNAFQLRRATKKTYD